MPTRQKKIEPVLGPTLVMDIDEGELYAPKIRLYIVKSPMPLPVIYKLAKQRKWMALLGYTPWNQTSGGGRHGRARHKTASHGRWTAIIQYRSE